MWIYDGLVKDAVVLSKFQHERSLASSLGIRLGGFYREEVAKGRI